jgi:hypothetical protein
MATDSKEIVRVFRSYKKENGWPMAHEAADLIEKLEKDNASWKECVHMLLLEVSKHNPQFIEKFTAAIEELPKS